MPNTIFIELYCRKQWRRAFFNRSHRIRLWILIFFIFYFLLLNGNTLAIVLWLEFDLVSKNVRIRKTYTHIAHSYLELLTFFIHLLRAYTRQPKHGIHKQYGRRKRDINNGCLMLQRLTKSMRNTNIQSAQFHSKFVFNWISKLNEKKK